MRRYLFVLCAVGVWIATPQLSADTTQTLFRELPGQEITPDVRSKALESNAVELAKDAHYFAKRYRYVTVDHDLLERAERFQIPLFRDATVTVERKDVSRSPVMLTWRGVIVEPITSTTIRSYPDGQPLDKEQALAIHQRQHAVKISSHVVPSHLAGESAGLRAIDMDVYVPALKKTFVVESLDATPAVHIVYELDQDKCCFATIDTELDPSNPVHAEMIRKAEAYTRHLRQVDKQFGIGKQEATQ